MSARTGLITEVPFAFPIRLTSASLLLFRTFSSSPRWRSLLEVLSAVHAAGQKMVRPRTEVRLGMVEDPDGNCVEFIQAP
jgi:hypothetical protein